MMYFVEMHKGSPLFLLGKNPRVSIEENNLFRGELIYHFEDGEKNSDDDFPFYYNHVRMLEPWEVIKYKLQGII